MSAACLGCGARLRGLTPRPVPLCPPCEAGIPWIRSAHCPHCGRDRACADCARRDKRHLLLNRSAVAYTGAMKAWLARYKYQGDEPLGALLGWMLEHGYTQLQRELQARGVALHAVTGVPLSDVRLRARGFNQAEQLAWFITRRSRLPAAPLLRRRVHTARQSAKSRAERMADLEHAFAVTEVARRELRPGMNILLVDDVYTTGATLHHCARVLRETCQVNPFSITWAR